MVVVHRTGMRKSGWAFPKTQSQTAKPLARVAILFVSQNSRVNVRVTPCDLFSRSFPQANGKRSLIVAGECSVHIFSQFVLQVLNRASYTSVSG